VSSRALSCTRCYIAAGTVVGSLVQLVAFSTSHLLRLLLTLWIHHAGTLVDLPQGTCTHTPQLCWPVLEARDSEHNSSGVPTVSYSNDRRADTQDGSHKGGHPSKQHHQQHAQPPPSTVCSHGCCCSPLCTSGKQGQLFGAAIPGQQHPHHPVIIHLHNAVNTTATAEAEGGEAEQTNSQMTRLRSTVVSKVKQAASNPLIAAALAAGVALLMHNHVPFLRRTPPNFPLAAQQRALNASAAEKHARTST
jgi:hypothetical protein